MSHVCQHYQALIALWDCQQLQKCDPFRCKTFKHLYQLQLHAVNLKPKILEGNEEVGRAIGEGCDTSEVQKLISYQQSMASPAHHAVDILETGHPLNAPACQFVLYLVVDIVGKVIFEELDPFEESSAEGEVIGGRRLDVEIGLGHRGLGDRLQQHALESHLSFFLGFGCHQVYKAKLYIVILSES